MNVTCLKCSWISFAVSRSYAENQQREFLAHYDSLPIEKAKECWGERRAHDYTCLKCSGTSFRPSTQEEMDKIYGCTINPVIYE